MKVAYDFSIIWDGFGLSVVLQIYTIVLKLFPAI